MKISFHTTKKPKGRELWFEYFYTAKGGNVPNGFNLRAHVKEDPLVRIYERISIRGEAKP